MLFVCIWHPELCTGVECDCDHVCSSPNSLPSMLADKDFPTEVKKKKAYVFSSNSRVGPVKSLRHTV